VADPGECRHSPNGRHAVGLTAFVASAEGGETTGRRCRWCFKWLPASWTPLPPRPKAEPPKAERDTLVEVRLGDLQDIEHGNTAARYGANCSVCHASRCEDYGYAERGPDDGHEEGCWLKAAIRKGESDAS